jgi:hypothetical protein
MSLGPEHVEAVTQAANKIHAAAVMLSNPTIPATASNTGNSTINVNMGGWGVAVAVACALFCLLLVIDMRNDQRDTNRKVERTQDYTNMLWQRYPELRPEKLQEAKKQ